MMTVVYADPDSAPEAINHALAFPAPCALEWLILERQANMQVHELMLSGAAFIGTPTERGFNAEGTGFFLSVTQDGLAFTYLITCRHVLTNLGGTSPCIRVNTKNNSFRIIPAPRSEWVEPPQRGIDIAVFPFDLGRWDHDDNLEISIASAPNAILTEKTAKHFGFSLGSEVFIVGAFVGRIGEKQNIPVVRVGNVAAMPTEPIWPYSSRRPAYLIETRSLGGISGSPVFFNTSFGHLYGGPPRPQKPYPGSDEIVMPYLLIGMIVNSHSGKYASDFTPDDSDEDIPELDGPEQILPPKDADFNAGISVALTIDQILEVINQPILQAARNATVEAKKRDVGARDA
jgi:hypothetical protein